MRKTLLIGLTLLLTSLMGCQQEGKVTLKGLDPSANSKGASAPSANLASASTAQIDSDRLKLTGAHLNEVTSVRLVGPGIDSILTIESKAPGSLIAKAGSALNLTLGAVFNIVLQTAAGATTFAASFNLVDGSITASKLSDMGANDGDVLTYNQTSGEWEPRALSGLSYRGTWDARTLGEGGSDSDPTATPAAGDYYVVSVGGSHSMGGISSWNAGDWAVYEGTTWEKVDNTSGVVSFNGRQGAVAPQGGDYTWAQINKTTSSVGDIADVDTTTTPPTDGQVLKWSVGDGKWIPADDSAGGVGSVTSADITDGTISNADISGTAAIAQSKIANLTTDLSARLNRDGSSAMTGDLNLGGNAITNVGNVDGVDVAALSTQVTTNTTNIAGKENTIAAGVATQYWRGDKTWQTLNTTAVNEGTNLYFTEARVRSTPLTGYSTGTNTAILA